MIALASPFLFDFAALIHHYVSLYKHLVCADCIIKRDVVRFEIDHRDVASMLVYKGSLFS